MPSSSIPQAAVVGQSLSPLGHSPCGRPVNCNKVVILKCNQQVTFMYAFFTGHIHGYSFTMVTNHVI